MSLWEDGFCDDQPLRQREIRRVLEQVGKDHRFLQQLLLLSLQMCPIGLFPHSSARSGAEPPPAVAQHGGSDAGSTALCSCRCFSILSLHHI